MKQAAPPAQRGALAARPLHTRDPGARFSGIKTLPTLIELPENRPEQSDVATAPLGAQKT